MGKFTIKPTNTGYVFNLKAGNGEVIAVSQVYKSLDGAKNGIASVQTNAPIAPVEDQTVEGYAAEKNPKFEIYRRVPFPPESQERRDHRDRRGVYLQVRLQKRHRVHPQERPGRRRRGRRINHTQEARSERSGLFVAKAVRNREASFLWTGCVVK